MKPFRALRVFGKAEGARLVDLTIDQLSAGEVLIEVHYSSLNYKDALAVTGKAPILKSYPLNAGIDAAGVVKDSQDARFPKGTEVLVTGCGIGEVVDGGFSKYLRVAGDSVVPRPENLTLKETMTLGTAGFTAALALERMEHNGQSPKLGPILITGASGGVGSMAIQIFSQNGYETIAVSGKSESHSYLKKLGAAQVVSVEELKLGSKPLESVRFGGAVDNVGGELLSQILASTELWGNVASIGMVASPALNTTVMPLILRGVSLLGASSNNCPRSLRHLLWQKLAGPWKPENLESTIHSTVGLDEIQKACENLINRKIIGRVLVDVMGAK